MPKIIEKSSSFPDITAQIHRQSDLTLSMNRIQSSFHHTQERENRILKSVSEGNIQSLKKVMDQALDGQYGTLSRDNPLRSQKNLEICHVTLVTRAAIEGGLHTEIAFTLSDLYIQEIELIRDVKDLRLLSNRMLFDFANQVNISKESIYSKPIAESLHLISNRLYEPLSVEEIAKYVGLSAHYFASRFKNEVGLPVMTYIQGEKIEEAKRLLASSKYTILEISDILGFHDQSHFTKLFLKRAGTTPRKYREHGVF